MLSKSSVAAQYRAALGIHGNSPAAVFWPKGRQDLRFEALTRHLPPSGFSLLDYGCGLAHLKPFLDARFENFTYTGVDMVGEFLALDREKYTDAHFIELDDPRLLTFECDHIVLSGVFNMLYSTDVDTHKKQVWETIETLYSLARDSLAVNFMTNKVDFRQVGAFHLDPCELVDFIRTRLSCRFVIDQSYMPYEYTAVIWKNIHVKRPELVFI